MRIEALAHRGYPPKFPENTMSSYEAAFNLGFTYLELDVHLSKDNVPVLMHDPTVDRMTNGKGLIKNFTFKELQALTVGQNERIPTLTEALEFSKNKMNISIEMKQEGNLYHGIEEIVLRKIKEAGMLNQVYVNSFDHYSIVNMRNLSKEIELGIIQPGASPAVFPFMKEINAKYLSVKIEFITDEYVQLCRESGIQIVVWPVDYEWQYDIVKRYPDVLSTTNNLEKFKEMFLADKNTN